jgi:phosphoadenosine phosphosulfate reductase
MAGGKGMTIQTEAMAEIATRAGEELEDASAEEIVQWAVDVFGDRLCATSSMADGLITHLISRIKPGIDVLFLDTGLHFAETIGTRDAISAVYDVNVVSLKPELSLDEQAEQYGKDLFARDPELCCFLRKVAPLERGLEPYDAWITGVRRDEAPTRARTKVVSWDKKKGKVKICPIARWTREDTDRYIARHGILQNPLLLDGYGSIGCRPCTSRIKPGQDLRAGRWAGANKTECGIHS